MRRASRRSLTLAIILAFLVLLTVGLFASVAAADTALPAPANLQALPAPDNEQPLSQATVVREITELRTEYSSTYLLADHTKRVVVYDMPIHFLDENGVWQEINTDLVSVPAAPESGLLLDPWPTPSGSYESASTPMDVTIASEAPGQAPVTVSHDGFTIDFNMVGASEAVKVVDGDQVTYLNVAGTTDVNYQVVADGLKETIELASVSAPNSYRYYVSHPGLDLRQDETGQWGFYRPNQTTPLFELSDVLTFDSSTNASGEPAYSQRADMTVAPTDGGSYITYTVPRSWLSDPARVYPVKIDPSITLGQADCTDTYISDQFPTTSYGSSDDLKVGYYDGAGMNYSLIKFNLGALRTPSLAYVTSAHLRMKQYHSYSSPPRLTRTGVMQESWSGASTWNSVAAGGWDLAPLDTQSQFTDGWLDQPCAWLTQAWVNADLANQGLIIYQNSNEGQTYWRKFRSREYATSTDRPRLVVDYTNPTTTVSNTARAYRVGDLVHVTVTVGDTGGNSQYIEELRLGVNRASSDANDYRGVMCWCDGGVPDSSGNWSSSPYKDSGGYFSAYHSDTDSTGTRFITPSLNRCKFNQTNGVFDFYFRINDNFGASTSNRFAVMFKMWTPNGVKNGLWTADWANVGSSFAVQAPTTASVSGSDWFTETAGADGKKCNVNGQGRGNTTLTWPAANNADGYDVYLWDGLAYQKVGRTVGHSATQWSTTGLGFFPSDSDIAAPNWTFAGGGTNPGNPFYRATTPSDATQKLGVTNSNLAGSAGVLTGDGTYIWVRGRVGRTDGPTKWQKFDAATGAYAGYINTTLSTTTRPLTAIAYANTLYSAYVTVNGSAVATMPGNDVSAGTARTLTFSKPPFDRNTGAAVKNSTSSGTVLLASYKDTNGVTTLYSVSDTLTTTGTTPNYDGYKIREYTVSGTTAPTATWTSDPQSISCSSSVIAGVTVDAKSIYLLGWTNDDTALVTTIDRTTHQITNQWKIGQGTGVSAGACTCFYDSSHNVTWMGALTASKLYQYAGSAGGFDLRDNPNGLYKQNGTQSIDWTHYSFRVVPFVGSGVGGDASAYLGTLVSLDNRTKHPGDMPSHTTVDLGGFAGQSAAAQLDRRALMLSTVDLSVASYGPTAALDRYYVSKRSVIVPDDPATPNIDETVNLTTTRFGTGWRFGFERNLYLADWAAGGVIRYVDAAGESYRFAGAGASPSHLVGPYGMNAVLNKVNTGTERDWRITLSDQSTLEFNSNGRLSRETDPHGDYVGYQWRGTSGLTILAANFQSIYVTFDAGDRIQVAEYRSYSDRPLPGTRTVSYSSGAGSAECTATYLFTTTAPAEAIQRRVRYEYNNDTAPKLMRISQESGSSWTLNGKEEFSYTSGDLTGITLPEALTSPLISADAHAEITYDADASASTLGQATVTRHGTVGPSASQTDPQAMALAKVYKWNFSNTVSSVLQPGDQAGAVSTFIYSPDNQVSGSTTPLGLTSRTAIDIRGNAIATSDPLGHGSVTIYPDYSVASQVMDRPIATIGANGGATYFTYEGVDLKSTESEISTSTAQAIDVSNPRSTAPTPSTQPKSKTVYTYGDVDVVNSPNYDQIMHRALLKTVQVTADGTNQPEVDYSDYSIGGQPQLVGKPNIALSSTGSSINTDQVTAAYDNFGQLLNKTVYSHYNERQPPEVVTVTLETNTYNAAGERVASTGPSAKVSSTSNDSYAVTTHAAYDGLGRPYEEWSTTSDSSQGTKKYGLVVHTLSPSGWALDDSFRDGFASSATELYHISSTYDGMGRQLTSDDSRISVDDTGAALKKGRIDYDYHGNVVSTWAEGLRDYDYHGATQTSYDVDDRVTAEWAPGGLGLSRQAAPTADALASVTYTYNLDGSTRLESHRDGTWTHYGYDAAGRVVNTRTPADNYNTTTKLFNVAITQSEYDLQDNVLLSIDASGVKTTYAYDVLGNKTYEALLTPEPLDGSDKPDNGSSNLDNSSTTTAYNNQGWVLAESSVEAVSTATSYDLAGRVLTHTQGDIRTANTYNDAGQTLTTQTGNANSGVYVRKSDLSYDSWGQMKDCVETPTGPDGTTMSTTDTESTELIYDSLGRITDKTVKRKTNGIETTLLDQTATYFDATDPLHTVTTSKYGWDATTAQSDPIQLAAHTAVSDGTGRETSATAKLTGGTNAYVRTSEWDAADRLSQSATVFGGSPALNMTLNYDYNDRVDEYWYDVNPTAGNEIMLALYSYDDATGRVDSEDHYFDSASGLSGDVHRIYTYSKDGRLKNASGTKYTFNGGGALTKVDYDDSTPSKVFTYSPRQKVTKMTSGSDVTIYKWNITNDQRASEGPTDANQTIVYSYTLSGELLSVLNKTDHTKTEFVYDGTGQRTLTTVSTLGTDNTTVLSQTKTEYVYDGLRLLAARKITGTSVDWTVTYFYDAGDSPTAGLYTPSAGDKVWFSILTNLRGDVLELLDVHGQRFVSYRYSVWGQPQDDASRATTYGGQTTVSASVASAIKGAQRLRYAGYAYDTTTGLYYCSARYYDPDTRQFVSRDPIKADGQESVYQYCNGNPVTSADPSGLYVPEESAEHSAEYDRGHYLGNGIKEWVGRPFVPAPHTGWWDPLAPPKALYKQACDVGSFTKHTFLHPMASAKYVWNHPGDVALRGMVGALTVGGDALVVLDVALVLTPGSEDEAASIAATGMVGRLKARLGGVIGERAAEAVGDSAGFGGLSRASEYGFTRYGSLAYRLRGSGLQAHHLVEQRFAEALGLAARDMKSIAVTPAEHQFFTNQWRSLISYGAGTRAADETVIRAAAAKVYSGYPGILRALGL